MANPVQRVVKKLRFWLFEERENMYAEVPKRRRQLNNAFLIQSFAALTGIVTFTLIPLVVWLITLKSFVIVYVISSVVGGALYATVSLYVKHLNKQYDQS